MTDDWMREVEKRTSKVEMQAAVEAVHRGNVEVRLCAIEDKLKWLVRLIIGTLLIAAIAYALRGGLTL
ncbi:MAG: pseudouridine synthase [Octadecabacter sp.]